MRVFVTGASGWVGSAVVPELISAGHQVVGLARSDASAAAIEAAGGAVVRGGLDDLDVLKSAAAEADGVIHLAFVHDFAQFDTSIGTDARAIEAFGEALQGTGKPLVVTSGTPIAAQPGQVATESEEPAPDSPAAGRHANAKLALALAERGVRSSVVGLPRSVYGEGGTGFVGRMVAVARDTGISGYVGDGSQRWPAVHVKDAAHLYRLALEHAPGASMLHAVGDEAVPIREIAEVIGKHLNLPVESVPADEFGFLGAILSVDQPASATITRELLDWIPIQPGLLEDLDSGHAFT
ncbi:SDR family oxidoreductase [Sciscionella sediminilitoris]|uniref:SDR family oxidoreductase n=1 Tax=Sciscionella sediminilitoris TaxID=1445613 RepID=UPI0004DF4590|nr:SDR family oxidoreductase [Sciscionella sp. SE31]